MLKKTVPLLLAISVLIGAAACNGKKSDAEQQAEKEKTWRAQQRVKAAQYYAEITEKFPDSQYAQQAKERLNALGGTPPPKAGTTPRPTGAAKKEKTTAKQ
jgi:hypothetical protein